MARMSENSAPTPAASVGVAQPVKIEPSTPTIRMTGGIRLMSEPVMRSRSGMAASSSVVIAGP